MTFADVRKALDACEAACTLLPVQRTIGANYAVQADMVVAIPIPLWEDLIVAIDHVPDEVSA